MSLPPGQFGGSAITDFFMGRLKATAHPYFAQIASLRTSAHLVIQRTGTVLQFVAFDQQAWHAGISRLGNRTHVNEFSIGIELEGLPNLHFTQAQYQQLIRITQQLLVHYPEISAERIVGHCDIAIERGKIDPGNCFDWNLYLNALQSN